MDISYLLIACCNKEEVEGLEMVKELEATVALSLWRP